jgi:DNA relaxase NicK
MNQTNTSKIVGKLADIFTRFSVELQEESGEESWVKIRLNNDKVTEEQINKIQIEKLYINNFYMNYDERTLTIVFGMTNDDTWCNM